MNLAALALGWVALTSPGIDLDDFFTRPEVKGSVSAALVTDAEGTVLYERNPDQRLVPASNQKILSAIYALLVLGPEHRGELKLWREGTVIIAEARAHPAITHAQLVGARETLQVPKGATLRVKSAYPTVTPPGWEWDDLPNRYAARPAAFSVDRGGFELWNRNGTATLRPANYGVRIVEGSRLRYDPSRGVVTVPKRLPKTDELLDTLAVPDAEVAAALVLGAKLEGRTETTPNRPPDVVLISPPLGEIVKDCLERSDNFVSEALLLSAAAHEAPFVRPDAPYTEAAERMKKRLVAETGLEPAWLRPMDGSGLSRHNLVSARALTTLLHFADRRWPEWREWLAAPGEGTLKNRLPGFPFWGKTGSLNSVSSLSGLSTDAEGKTLAISLVFNHFVAPATDIRRLQDEIVAKIGAPRRGTDFEDYYDRERSHPHPSDFALRWNWSR